MSRSTFIFPRSIRLGLFAGALFCAPVIASSQIVAPPATDAPIPPKQKTDTTREKKRDTIQPPIGRSFGVRGAELGPALHWNGNEIFATGAITLTDLLERIPGITVLRSGWIATPQYAELSGGIGRIKIYLDGVELDNLNPRANALDLSWIPLWSLEDIAVERSAGEVRISLKTWAVQSTTAYTRTDVYTGDENTNLYRGYYGKRYRHGEGFQLGAQQFSTTNPRSGGGDELSILSRVAIGKANWSLDAFATRAHLTRELQQANLDTASIPPLDASYTVEYLRLSLGKTTGGPWAQIIASSIRFAESGSTTGAAAAATNLIPVDTVDTARSESQYFVRAGWASQYLRSEVNDRIRALNGTTYHDAVAQVEIATAPVTIGARVKHSEFGSSRAEAWGKLMLGNLAGVSAVIGKQYKVSGEKPSPEVNSLRIEGGVNLLGAWLAAGFLQQDTMSTAPPNEFGFTFSRIATGKDRGKYVSLRGPFFRGFSSDSYLLRWDDVVAYRPQIQSRTELRLHSQWLSRFPTGDFDFSASGIYDYRSAARFPTTGETKFTLAGQTVSLLIELRIMRAVLTYQLRNMNGYNYTVVPGFLMPRGLNLYGVRWEFWN